MITIMVILIVEGGVDSGDGGYGGYVLNMLLVAVMIMTLVMTMLVKCMIVF